ncbi:hypothetical protein I4F81_012936 [Pyropia yezoensis]|uniref:Major facilitator superfamily (MFS) profile domain-containing protein n=1 Tax=Pyropia yezoensis TaxID=2788 RepID=A0ABQ9T9U6_PYRYE|nr:hypothetical protein I4F81_012936 [Neopyropia yezoensis]
MFTGLTVALVTGVPLGTLIGQNFGWRATFLVVSLLGLIAFIGSALLVPKNLKQSAPAKLREQLQVLMEPRLLLVYLITALGYGGTFTAFTYLAPILEQVSGFSANALRWYCWYMVYVVQLAEKYTPNAVDVASGLNIAAFNVGIALGSLIGGLVVEDMSLMDTPWIGAVIVGLAIILTRISGVLDSRSASKLTSV